MGPISTSVTKIYLARSEYSKRNQTVIPRIDRNLRASEFVASKYCIAIIEKAKAEIISN